MTTDEHGRAGAGHTGAQGEGGGSLSGRGQEAPGEPRGGADERETNDSPAGAPTNEASEGLSTSLQPGGTIPGGGPGDSQGSLGTGGGSTGGSNTGAVRRGGR
jgi:hypothetical protein